MLQMKGKEVKTVSMSLMVSGVLVELVKISISCNAAQNISHVCVMDCSSWNL